MFGINPFTSVQGSCYDYRTEISPSVTELVVCCYCDSNTHACFYYLSFVSWDAWELKKWASLLKLVRKWSNIVWVKVDIKFSLTLPKKNHRKHRLQSIKHLSREPNVKVFFVRGDLDHKNGNILWNMLCEYFNVILLQCSLGVVSFFFPPDIFYSCKVCFRSEDRDHITELNSKTIFFQ